MQKYLLAYVLIPRDFCDCSNNGVSVTGSTFYVPCPEGNWSEEDVLAAKERDKNVVILEVEKRIIGMTKYVNFVEKDKRGRPMAGGCFIYSTDSRFMREYGGPVSLHDRYELY